MKLPGVLIAVTTILTACVPASPQPATDVTASAPRAPVLAGTWQLVSTRATRNDSVVMQGGPPDLVAVKILNATDYAVITHRNGQFMRAGGGRYTISGNSYSEMIETSSGQHTGGTVATFTFTLEGDVWTTEGGTAATRFREVWRRIR